MKYVHVLIVKILKKVHLKAAILKIQDGRHRTSSKKWNQGQFYSLGNMDFLKLVHKV